MFKALKLSVIVLVLLLLPNVMAAQELTIAAAADLRFALQDIAGRFQKQTGHPIKLSFGSSGNFFSQIQNGAPYDLFFSADVDYPQKLNVAGLTEPGSLYEYATGKLVLWVTQQSPLDLKQGMQVFLDPRIKKIAIANPQHAPYGRAAEAALRSAGLYDRVKGELVLGENISQTAEFVETGNADIGLLAFSLAVSPTMKAKGRFVDVPGSLYPPLKQGVVVLKSSRNRALANQFLDFLKRPESAALLRQYGFAVPASAATK